MRDKQLHNTSGSVYHVVNHSIDGRDLYYNPGDYKNYLHFFKEALTVDVIVLAYCLMPNHFHFLLQQNTPEAISNLFEAANKRYARYYNKEHGFKGRVFRAQLQYREAMDERYLLNASAYIHANPVQAKLIDLPEQWDYSNFKEYMRLRSGTLFSKQFLQDYIGNPETYRQRVIELAHKKSMQRAFERDILK